jgi:hypothetical protein
MRILQNISCCHSLNWIGAASAVKTTIKIIMELLDTKRKVTELLSSGTATSSETSGIEKVDDSDPCHGRETECNSYTEASFLGRRSQNSRT